MMNRNVCIGDPARRDRQLVVAARDDLAGARQGLIEAYTPRVRGVARIYRRVPSVSHLELMQAGVLGLLRALQRFDPDQGTSFWAYASWWVRESMQHLVADVARPVVLSDRAHRDLARVYAARAALARRNGRQPTTRELADESGVGMKQLQALLVAERTPRGLEEPLRAAGTLTVRDCLPDPSAEDDYEGARLRANVREVPRLLARLSDRERAVVKARHGLDCEARSLRELGRAMGVSTERVRQIEVCALEKMRGAA
jgi:RNA polymerase sigma factor (sigma-70 family)